VSEERRPDTQAELANERTYLAWLRTGLALVAVGVAAEQVLPAEGIIWARQLIGVSLILAGVLTAGLARWRWQRVDRADSFRGWAYCGTIPPFRATGHHPQRMKPRAAAPPVPHST
jgi:uncharacterized membrane protein YidH (DUF202 family)